MIRIDTDEAINEIDFELIQEFAIALMDKDHYAMKEVLYILHEKMSGDCVCLEEECICGSW
jgi:hypothetical protein